MRLMIVKLGALGDVVRTTALLPGLKKHFGSVEIHWLTSSAALPLVDGLDGVKRCYAFSKVKDRAQSIGKFDWVISLDDEEDVCKFVNQVQKEKLTGAYWDNSTQLCSYTEDSEAWFGMGILRSETLGGISVANKIKKENRKSHPQIFYKMLGLGDEIVRPQLPMCSSYVQEVEGWLEERASLGHWIGLNTGAAHRWKYKSWLKESTLDLALRLVSKYRRSGVLILGGREEKERNEWIVNQSGHDRIFLGPTKWGLLKFSALIGQCQLLVSSDSLALHLANAQSVPVVSFFGPTSSHEIELYESGQKVITELPCRCCYLKDCTVRPHCMADITVERMEEAIASVIKEEAL